MLTMEERQPVNLAAIEFRNYSNIILLLFSQVTLSAFFHLCVF